MDEHAQHLLDTLARVLPAWLEGCVVESAVRIDGACPEPLRRDAAEMSARCSPIVIEEMGELLATDVERQRTNPLSIVRSAVRWPTGLLVGAGLAPVRRDEFAVRTFPGDLYGLCPATWAEIDESLREPGLIWGVWKARTVLERHR